METVISTKITNNEKETFEFGKNLKVGIGDVVLLEGELGAGKTALVRGICDSLGVPPEEVHSPTFAIVNEYKAREAACLVYHIDAYRLTAKDWETGGFSEYITNDSICLIEWANNLNLDGIRIRIEGSGGEPRCISLG